MSIKATLLASLSCVAISTAIAESTVTANNGPLELKTRVYTGQVIGEIKKDLAGVSLGGNTPSFMTDHYIQGAKDLGVRYVRLETITSDFRELYNPETKIWNWEKLDREIENIHSTGAKIIANIFYTPRFLSTSPDDKAYAYFTPNDWAEWKKYVQEIVRHVNIEKGHKILYWEIGNEPSGAHFYRASMDHFWNFYDVTAEAIKGADPTALVGGFGDNPAYPEHLENFFNKVKAPIDFLTIHWYAEWSKESWRNPEAAALYGTATMAYFQRTFGKRVPMMLTEWNSAAELNNQSIERIAGYMAAGFYWMQDSPIDIACFFRLEPFHSDAALLNGQGVLRAPGRVFRMYSMLGKNRVNMSELRAGIFGLASREEQKISILVGRYDTEGKTENIVSTLIISGLKPTHEYDVTTYIENAETTPTDGPLLPKTQSKITSEKNGTITVSATLDSYAVSLITLHPAEPAQ